MSPVSMEQMEWHDHGRRQVSAASFEVPQNGLDLPESDPGGPANATSPIRFQSDPETESQSAESRRSQIGENAGSLESEVPQRGFETGSEQAFTGSPLQAVSQTA